MSDSLILKIFYLKLYLFVQPSYVAISSSERYVSTDIRESYRMLQIITVLTFFYIR